jgi:hypothetical protein
MKEASVQNESTGKKVVGAIEDAFGLPPGDKHRGAMETSRILQCSLADPSEFVAYRGIVHPAGRFLWHVSAEKTFALNGTRQR